MDMADTMPGPAGRQVVRGDLTVTKRPDPGSRPVPAVTLRVSSEYEVPVAVRIVEPLPDDADPDRLCVPATDADNWTVADDGLAWSGHVPPGGEAEAVYGVLPADADEARTFLGAPVVDAVHPAAEESDGGPKWRAGGTTPDVRTMADLESDESPAALAAAEATMRAAMAGDADAADADAPDVREAAATSDADAADAPAGGTRWAATAPGGHDAPAGDPDRTDPDRDDPDRRAPDADRCLEVAFDPDAPARARERALRAFARTADVTGCTPGIGRVAAGRADSVRLRVAGGGDGLAEGLRDRDAVSRVVDVPPGGDQPPDDPRRPERTFRALKREYDRIPPADLERELADATADGGPLDEEAVGLGELVAEFAEDDARDGVTATATAGPETTDVPPDDPPGTEASGPPAAVDSDADAPPTDADPPETDGRPLVAALVAALDGAASEDQVAALRDALDVPSRGDDALRDRVDRLEAAVDDLEAAVERVAGLRPFVADLYERTETVEDAVESLTEEAGEARLDRSVLESDVGQLSREVEALRERVADVEGPRDGAGRRRLRDGRPTR